MNKASAFLTGAGLGAGLVYFLDPEMENRRAMLRNQAIRTLNQIGAAVESSAFDLQRRAIDLTAELKARLLPPMSPDETLAARLRSELRFLVSQPTAVEISTQNGRVTLKGTVFGEEMDRLLSAISSMRGVGEVENQLQARRPEERVGLEPKPAREEMDPTARLLVGAAGAALALYAIRRQNVLATMIGAIGLGLLSRGLTTEAPLSTPRAAEEEKRPAA